MNKKIKNFAEFLAIALGSIALLVGVILPALIIASHIPEDTLPLLSIIMLSWIIAAGMSLGHIVLERIFEQWWPDCESTLPGSPGAAYFKFSENPPAFHVETLWIKQKVRKP